MRMVASSIRRVVALALLLGMAGCAQQRNVPLIPREVLLGNFDRGGLMLSPDGTKVGFLAPLDGVMNVWVAPRQDLSAAVPVTRQEKRGVFWYGWACTNQHILYRRDTNGDENWGIYAVDLQTGRERDLTPNRKWAAALAGGSHSFPDEVLIVYNDHDGGDADMHRVNIRTGEDRIVLANPRKIDGQQVVAFVPDSNLDVRLAVTLPLDGGTNEYLRAQTAAPTTSTTQPAGWKPLPGISPQDSGQVGSLNLNRGGDLLYVWDARGRNTLALSSIALDTGETKVLAQDPRADFSDGLLHPRELTMQAAAFYYDRRRWVAIDPAVREDLEYLESASEGDFRIGNSSLDDRYWTVSYDADDQPVRHFIYDREERKLGLAFIGHPALAAYPLARMHPVVIKSRDGLDMVSYYTLPINAARDGGTLPNRPLPMVLLVHGGPWGRDEWGLSLEHQWLANRGYAVFSVNYRGSTGFGKAFGAAGNGEWGGKMHDDLIDAVNWAIDEGIADPRRIAIMGSSYGGYAALAGLTFTPDTFACGIDLCGPSDLLSFMKTLSPAFPGLRIRIGDENTEQGRGLLEGRSPLNFVDRIKRPLLIAHGANDPRVKKSESDRLVAAMQAKKIPVTYLVYDDEGHDLVRIENRLSYFAAVEAFLAEHLGGRAEPIGGAFDDSSIRVEAGAWQIPGPGRRRPRGGEPIFPMP